MSLWCLMASPLIYSGDMTKLDEFTLNVLCNPELIEIDQDPLGEGGLVISRNEEQFVMIKKLRDNTVAVGLFNRGLNPAQLSIDFSEIGMKGKQKVRDAWRQKDIGNFRETFSAMVPAQGVVMVRIGTMR